MRVVTWNVNSWRAHGAGVVAWLEAQRPDVVALQETMCAPIGLPHRVFRDLGYEVAAVGEPGRLGVALLSARGLHDVSLGVPGAVAPFDEPRVVSATIEGVRVHAAYAPNGRRVATPAHAFKLAWFQWFAAVVGADLDEQMPTIVLGDLNIAPTDTDIWDASRYRRRNLTSPAERAAFASLLQLGLVDVVRAADLASCFSWWNRRGDFFETDRGWRLDHVLTDVATSHRVAAVSIDRDARRTAGTDHAPVIVTLTDEHDRPTSNL